LDTAQSSSLNVKRRFGRTSGIHLQGGGISPAKHQFCLSPAFTLAPFSAYSSALKMEAIRSSENSISFIRLQGNISPKIENRTPLNSRCESFKPETRIDCKALMTLESSFMLLLRVSFPPEHLSTEVTPPLVEVEASFQNALYMVKRR
jgi:hypothetical protein